MDTLALFKNIFSLTDYEKELDEVINEIEELKADIPQYILDESDLGETFGRILEAKDSGMDNDRFVEILVMIIDKMKQRMDDERMHNINSIEKILNIKVKLVRICKRRARRYGIIREIFSVRTAVVVIVTIITVIAMVVAVHKYDREIFYDLGVAKKGAQNASIHK